MLQFIFQALAGASSSVESSDSDPADIQDHARIFGMSHRDLQRSSRMTSMSDLSARQIALVMSQCQKFVCAAGLLAIGGEVEACMITVALFFCIPKYLILEA